MSQNLKDLLATAAEMRAVGHPWEAVAKHVHRRVKTCQNWPARHKAHWDPLYHQAQKGRFESTANECHTYLLALVRDKDPKVRHPALALWLKHGAQAYGAGGTMAPPAPPPAAPTANDELARQVTEGLAAIRDEMNRKRAARGEPPVSDDVFIQTYQAEVIDWYERHKARQQTPPGPDVQGGDPDDPLGLKPWDPSKDYDAVPGANDDDDEPPTPPPPAQVPPPAASNVAGNPVVVFGVLLLAAAVVWHRPTYIAAPAGPEFARGLPAEVPARDGRWVFVRTETPDTAGKEVPAVRDSHERLRDRPKRVSLPIAGGSHEARRHDSHRVAGRHRDHRHSDRTLAAGGPEGPRGGQPDEVQEQPQADRPGPAQPPRRDRLFPGGHHDRRVGQPGAGGLRRVRAPAAVPGAGQPLPRVEPEREVVRAAERRPRLDRGEGLLLPEQPVERTDRLFVPGADRGAAAAEPGGHRLPAVQGGQRGHVRGDAGPAGGSRRLRCEYENSDHRHH